MTPDLVMIVPSRGRPQAVGEMHAALVAAQTTCAQTIFVVDADDETWPGYQAAAESFTDDQLVLAMRIGLPDGTPRVPGVVQPLNLMAHYVAQTSPAFAIGFMGDDHRPRLTTVPWDWAYVAELRKLGTGMVYGNDLLQGANIPTQIAMTADIVRALSYMVYPGLKHLYADNAWKALGEATGCIRYLPEVIVEHMHPVAGKAAMDEGYARVNAADIDQHDAAVFNAYRESTMLHDAAEIRNLRQAHA